MELREAFQLHPQVAVGAVLDDEAPAVDPSLPARRGMPAPARLDVAGRDRDQLERGSSAGGGPVTWQSQAGTNLQPEGGDSLYDCVPIHRMSAFSGNTQCTRCGIRLNLPDPMGVTRGGTWT